MWSDLSAATSARRAPLPPLTHARLSNFRRLMFDAVAAGVPPGSGHDLAQPTRLPLTGLFLASTR